jgi:excisionase family DNA binding protein
LIPRLQPTGFGFSFWRAGGGGSFSEPSSKIITPERAWAIIEGMRAADIRKRLEAERKEAISSRDPLAIRFALDRYEVLTALLADYADDAPVDPDKITLRVSQAAKALGFTPNHVRQLIRQGKIQAFKANNEWRIPLRVVL